MSKPLNPADVAESVSHNRLNAGRCPSYTVPLPGAFPREGLYVGCLAKNYSGSIYVVVDFVDEFAVIVPLFSPVCAYTHPAASLQWVDPREVTT
jgi:hypothetical protein